MTENTQPTADANIAATPAPVAAQPVTAATPTPAPVASTEPAKKEP